MTAWSLLSEELLLGKRSFLFDPGGEYEADNIRFFSLVEILFFWIFGGDLGWEWFHDLVLCILVLLLRFSRFLFGLLGFLLFFELFECQVALFFAARLLGFFLFLEI